MDQLSKYPHLNRYVSNLRSIPGGQFHWGASPSKEELGIPITMSPFCMGATPVTWGMWKEYRQSVTVSGTDDDLDDFCWGGPDNHPVVKVSWEDIMNPGGFCEWASGVAGFKLTLPTDAQYEYAARGGQDGLEYPWDNDFDESLLWCSEEEYADTDAVDRTNRIYRNGYGLTDMVGKVWQWCADYYHEDYRPDGEDPVNTQHSKHRCVRGGWFKFDLPDDFRCASRDGKSPDSRYRSCGFRLSAGLV
jgi:sulfatase modifying factor 1